MNTILYYTILLQYCYTDYREDELGWGAQVRFRCYCRPLALFVSRLRKRRVFCAVPILVHRYFWIYFRGVILT